MMDGQAPVRVACYARVSTEDQAERQTVESQINFLRRYCDLHQLPIADFYVDDGVSGATPLEGREDGLRLLQDAEAGKFNVVLVHRLDRLARSLDALLSAHKQLDRVGVAIRSGTEPFDTASPIGRFLFSLLGGMAELERATISERMSRGRDRVAKQGQYTGGPLATGYDLDLEGKFVPSSHMVPKLNFTEAELVRDIFRRIADEGSSLNAEATRLTSLGVPRIYRYAVHAKRKEQKVKERPAWTLTAIASIIHNPMYKGSGALRSKYGKVEFEAPALVDTALWERAQQATIRNRKLSKKNAKREYHLRGLIRCDLCGLAYVGATNYLNQRYYRCHGQMGKSTTRREPCAAGIVNADRLEEGVWQEVMAFADDPGPYIEDARLQLRARLTSPSRGDEQRNKLATELTGKEQERERVLGMFRRGRISSDEADRELDAIAAEADQIRTLIASLDTQAHAAKAHEEYLLNAARMLASVRGRVRQIDEENDWVAKREIVELLVPQMIVRTQLTGTTPKGRRRKTTRVTLTLAYRSDVAVVSATATAGRSTT